MRRLDQVLALPLPSSEMVGSLLNLSLSLLIYKTDALLTASLNYK